MAIPFAAASAPAIRRTLAGSLTRTSPYAGQFTRLVAEGVPLTRAPDLHALHASRRARFVTGHDSCAHSIADHHAIRAVPRSPQKQALGLSILCPDRESVELTLIRNRDSTLDLENFASSGVAVSRRGESEDQEYRNRENRCHLPVHDDLLLTGEQHGACQRSDPRSVVDPASRRRRLDENADPADNPRQLSSDHDGRLAQSPAD